MVLMVLMVLMKHYCSCCCRCCFCCPRSSLLYWIGEYKIVTGGNGVHVSFGMYLYTWNAIQKTSTVTNGEPPNSNSSSVQWTRDICLHYTFSRSINFKSMERSERFQACRHPTRCVRSGIQLSVNQCQISLVLRNSEGQMTIEDVFACSHRLAELWIYVCIRCLRCSGEIVAQWCPGCPGGCWVCGRQLSKSPVGCSTIVR